MAYNTYRDDQTPRNIFANLGRTLVFGVTVVIIVVAITLAGKVVESVNANEIVCIQDWYDGELHWYKNAGLYPQWFGTETTYSKRYEYEFTCSDFEEVEVKRKDFLGKEVPIKIQQCFGDDKRIEIRFNDGGHGKVDGSIQWEMPLIDEMLTRLHTRFGNSEAIQKQLVETIVNKSIYMTGPLMSSKESYADRRNDLIRYVEDQIENGVYQTIAREMKEKDALSGVEKTVRIVELVIGKDGKVQRQETGQLTAFGIRPFNFAIKRLPYDETVEQQIQQQQQLAMQVATSQAEARQAEQRAITAAKDGEANAAKAKWEQEVIKAKAVVDAEQKKEVARLDAEAADHYRVATLRRAEADATYKQRVMQADGALTPKLDAMVKINDRYAQAIERHQGSWTPVVMMGQPGAQGGNAFNAALPLIDLITARTAQQLGLDMRVSGTAATQKQQ